MKRVLYLALLMVHCTRSHNERTTYVTLVTNDEYVPGAQVLAASLSEVGARHPMLALISQRVGAEGRQTLQRTGFELREISAVNCEVGHNEWATSESQKQLISTCTKLQLWNLTDFGKVVYLDADTMVLANLDHLFDRGSGFAAAPDLMPPDAFNTGVMVLVPNATEFASLLEQLKTLPSHDGGDQGFLNSYFPGWFSSPAEHRLPIRYNMQQHMAWLYPPAWNSVRDPMVIHFCGSGKQKPWNVHDAKGSPELLRPHLEKWWALYTASFDKMEGASQGKEL